MLTLIMCGVGVFQIDVRRFRDVVMRLELLETEVQLSKAIDDFSDIADKYAASHTATHLTCLVTHYSSCFLCLFIYFFYSRFF